jgi:glycosyltransferase involved in cell wall biosynthesis
MISVTSPSFKEYIGGLCGLPCEKISWNPQHATDVGVVPFAEHDDCVHFSFIGNIGISQNLELILKATAALKEENFKLHIVGSGSNLANVQKLVEELSISDKVVFYGRRPKDQMREFYELSHVCIVSLRTEGVVSYTIPGKLQEYMSAGRAILGSISGDADRVIKEAECGLCSESDDVEAFKANMWYMIRHKNQLRTWGENARKYYLNRFTLSKHIEKLEEEMGLLRKV